LDLDDIDADIDAIPGAIAGAGADGSEVLLFGDEEDALNAAANPCHREQKCYCCM